MSEIFEIKQKTKVKVNIYGKEFSLSKPTVGQVESLQKLSGIEKKSESEQFELIMSYLDVLGLPVEFSKQMEIDHLIKLINHLSGELNISKKKSEAGL